MGTKLYVGNLNYNTTEDHAPTSVRSEWPRGGQCVHHHGPRDRTIARVRVRRDDDAPRSPSRRCRSSTAPTSTGACCASTRRASARRAGRARSAGRVPAGRAARRARRRRWRRWLRRRRRRRRWRPGRSGPAVAAARYRGGGSSWRLRCRPPGSGRLRRPAERWSGRSARRRSRPARARSATRGTRERERWRRRSQEARGAAGDDGDGW